MRRLGSVVGPLVVSCLLAGCGHGGESTATPENLEAARDAAKKMILREAAAKEKLKPKAAPTAQGAAKAPESGRKD